MQFSEGNRLYYLLYLLLPFFCREQRLSILLAYLLVALTPTMRPILRYIPFGVLYGLFITALFKTFVGTQVG